MFGIPTQIMDRNPGPTTFASGQKLVSPAEDASQFTETPLMEALGVLVQSPGGDTLEMAGRDLCSSGMSVEPGRWTMQQLWSDGQPGPGESLTIQILLPFGPYGGSYELEVGCRVVQVIRISERRYEIALTFESMPEASRRTLSDYLAEGVTTRDH